MKIVSLKSNNSQASLKTSEKIQFSKIITGRAFQKCCRLDVYHRSSKDLSKKLVRTSILMKTFCYFFFFFRGQYLKKTSYHFQNKISTKSITIKIYSAYVLYDLF